MQPASRSSVKRLQRFQNASTVQSIPMQEKVAAPQAAEQIQASVTEFLNLHEFVAKARQNLSQNHWDYIVGAAETETTLRRNRMALDAIAFRPRILTDVSKVDASVE